MKFKVILGHRERPNPAKCDFVLKQKQEKEMETLALISPGDTRKHYMPEIRTGVTNKEYVEQQFRKKKTGSEYDD